MVTHNFLLTRQPVRRLARASGMRFLFWDGFLTDDAVPITNPRTSEPGPGGLDFTDDDANKQYIDGGKLIMPVPAVSAWGNMGWVSTESWERTAGKAFLFKPTFTTAGLIMIGWNDTDTIDTNFDGALYHAVAFANSRDNGDLQFYTSALPTGVEYTFASVLRAQGNHFCGKGGVLGDEWRLLDPHAEGSDNTPLWIMGNNRSAEVELDALHVADLVNDGYTVWAHRDLDKTDGLATPANGNAFTHTPDFVMRLTVTTAPSAQSASVDFRRTDVENLCRFTAAAVGEYRVISTVDGVPAIRINGGVPQDGDIVELVVEGADCELFVNGVSLGAYDALPHATATDGRINSIGDSVLADLTCRTLDSAAANGTQGIATDLQAGPISGDDTFTHEADCIIEWQMHELPASDGYCWFRIQDADNRWHVHIDNATGSVTLYERVDASNVQRATDTPPLAGTERILIICDDEMIRVHEDNSVAFTYSSAANFKTETDGQFDGVSADHWSDRIAWPRVFSGQALRALQRLEG